MTQSGQGDEPRLPAAQPPAHEGVVLPADGSGPWIPGSVASGEQATPTGGQPWGQPWGPQSEPPAPQPQQGQMPQQPGRQAPRPMEPLQQVPQVQQMPQGQLPPVQHGQHAPQGQPPPFQQQMPQQMSQQMPQQGQMQYGQMQPNQQMPAQQAPDHQMHAQQGQSQPGQQIPQQPQHHMPQHGPQAQPGQLPQMQPYPGQLPPQQEQQPQPGQQYPQPGQQYPQYPPPQGQQHPQQPGQMPQPQHPGEAWGQQYPPAQAQQAPQPQAHSSAYSQGQGGPQAYAQPLPPENAGGGSDADATQYIAAYVPPAAPVGPGALPPENPADSTQFLGRSQDMPVAPAPMSGADAESTQFLPPVPAGQNPPAPPPGAPYGVRPGAPEDRQPPAEFDSLFRADAAPEAPDATQQMPRFDAQQQAGQHPGHQAAGQPQFAQPQGRAARRNAAAHGAPAAQAAPSAYAEPAAPRRRSSPVALIAAVVVGCAVVGLGAGWLMSGGDDEKSKGNQPVAAASTPGDENSPKAAEDPAKPQAESLDALLADSNNSRASVIRSVAAIGTCKNLPKAASDLRDAAKQRDGLVTRLQTLTIDKLPDHAQLSSSLTAAWKASAAADNHYAAWANQVGGKKGCPKGHARSTPQQQAGNRESGNASKAKKEAVGMWNAIAEKHGLTKRDATQL